MKLLKKSVQKSIKKFKDKMCCTYSLYTKEKILDLILVVLVAQNFIKKGSRNIKFFT